MRMRRTSKGWRWKLRRQGNRLTVWASNAVSPEAAADLDLERQLFLTWCILISSVIILLGVCVCDDGCVFVCGRRTRLEQRDRAAIQP